MWSVEDEDVLDSANLLLVHEHRHSLVGTGMHTLIHTRRMSRGSLILYMLLRIFAYSSYIFMASFVRIESMLTFEF